LFWGLKIWFFFFFGLQALFPGLWLAEVTVDTYQVPELPENGKV
jgi:hypothetical protein